VVSRMSGPEFNTSQLSENGFSNPVILEPRESIEGLQMVPSTFDFYNVPQLIGIFCIDFCIKL
jgi:hypothetical protein